MEVKAKPTKQDNATDAAAVEERFERAIRRALNTPPVRGKTTKPQIKRAKQSEKASGD